MGCSSSTSAQNVRIVTSNLIFFIASVRLSIFLILTIAEVVPQRQVTEVPKIQLSLKKLLEPEEDLIRLPVKPLLPRNQRTSQKV